MNDPKYRKERLPARVEHHRVGTGGEYHIRGSDQAVDYEIRSLEAQYPYNPYGGFVKTRFKSGNETFVIFKYYGID